MRAWILAGLVLAGCGSDETSTEVKPENVAASGEHGESPDKTDNSRTMPDGRAMYFATDAERPPCSEADEGWLIYQDGFLVCQGGEWVAIDLKGEKGDPGEVIKQDGEYWEDPFTGITWRLFGVNSQCAEGYRLPTITELATAASNGIYIAIGRDGAYARGKIAGESGMNFYYFDFDVGQELRADDPGLDVGSYCIQQ